jgi:LmbE family N-acetylglucosaminyl deacetylase
MIKIGESLLAERRILIIAPHPDDETFGCGGLIARAKSLGSRIHVLVISAPNHLRHFNSAHPEVSGETRIEEFTKAMAVLGVDDHCVAFQSDSAHMRLDVMPQIELIRLIETESPLSIESTRPDIICIPARSYNQDHRAVFDAALSACRPHLPGDKAFVPVVLAYDQPQLSWYPDRFAPNLYVDIADHLATKLAAYECYRSQIRPEPHHASIANVERLARLRGSEVSIAAAEAFHCHRLVV